MFTIFQIALFIIFYIALAIAWHRIVVRYAKRDDYEIKFFAAVWPASFIVTLVCGMIVLYRERKNKTKNK